MTTTEVDQEIVASTHPLWSTRRQRWVNSFPERDRVNEEFHNVWFAGMEGAGRHNPLYHVKDEEFCSCLYGADCGAGGRSGARTDIEGPEQDAAGAFMYWRREGTTAIPQPLIDEWIKLGRPRRGH